MKKLFIKVILIIILFISLLIIPDNVLAESFDGEYSIDYLLKNYSLVTLGQNSSLLNHYYDFSAEDIGDIRFTTNSSVSHYIEGPILVNGDFVTESPIIINSLPGNNKSYIKGSKSSTISVQSDLVTDSNYIDFNKLYNVVLRDSYNLAEASTNYINDKKIEIDRPGNYTINNTSLYWCDSNNFAYGNYYNYCTNNTILIKNFDSDSLYIFNMYNEIINLLPSINIIEKNSSNVMSLRDYVLSGKYKGNIIFNFPRATFINVGYFYSNYGIYYSNLPETGFTGNIIAPNAEISFSYNYGNISDYSSSYHGTIIANGFRNNYIDYLSFNVYKTNYELDDKIESNNCNYFAQPKDYNDDYYSRSYSISDLLQNYSLVTLGHKRIDSKSKLSQFGDVNPGSMKLFHITGQALVSGFAYGGNDGKVAFDLESNKVTESFVNGFGQNNISVIQPWDNMASDTTAYIYQKNSLFLKYPLNNGYGPGLYTSFFNYSTVYSYINFDRLYNNVVAEQKGIEEGDKVKASNGVAHIPIGGNYVIDDVSDINKIVFDNFEENKDVITIVTIKNSGDINFPEINKDKGYYKGIITNDYYGKKQATHLYERDTFVTEDGYYGNIIFNVPNATYIKLKENVPFAGHLIAPNADVETEETHFAGCFIVNSIYGEGNTEAHFYPLTAYDNCECSVGDQVPESLHARFNELRLSRLLGGEKSVVETNIIGDQAQYKKDTDQLNQIIDNCPMRKHYSSSISDILKNPPTYGTIGAVLLIVIGLIVGFEIYKKKNKNNTN